MNKTTRLGILTAMLFALIVVCAAPATSLAQGRGRGHGRGPDLDKKRAKFINGHDARDGRWDGRGPVRSRSVLRNGVLLPQSVRVRNRNRDFDNDDLLRRQRRIRHRNRDFDNDNLRIRNERARLRLAQRRVWLRRNR
ncbi:MAG TPA: hypothetical protein VGJ55_02730 [Pyrinomonadaceae bacterium]